MNTDGFQPFLIFSSPWEQVAVFFFLFLPPPPLSVLSRPVFEVSLSLSLSFTPWFSPYLGGCTLSRIQWEKNLCPFLFQIHFYPFLSQEKLNGITTTVLCGKKEKPSAPLALLGAGGC